MEETKTRDAVRREIRAAVYRACWSRLDGNGAAADAQLSHDLPSVLAPLGESTPGPETLESWVEQDRADFDHAVLVSEMIARRLPAVAPTAHLRVLEKTPPVPVNAPPARPVPGVVPAIADLLDDMLAQQKQTRRAS